MKRFREEFLADKELAERYKNVEEVASEDAPHSTDYGADNGVTDPVAVIVHTAQAH